MPYERPEGGRWAWWAGIKECWNGLKAAHPPPYNQQSHPVLGYKCVFCKSARFNQFNTWREYEYQTVREGERAIIKKSFTFLEEWRRKESGKKSGSSHTEWRGSNDSLTHLRAADQPVQCNTIMCSNGNELKALKKITRQSRFGCGTHVSICII